MTTTPDLADPAATTGNATFEALSGPRRPALLAFDAATRPTRVLVEANGITVEILCGAGAGDYRMAVGRMESDNGPILAATLATVQRLVAALEAPPLSPTPTARSYDEYGMWVDVQGDWLMCYAMGADGGWDEDPSAVEFTCQHMLDRINADFGTDFTMDEFEEGDECTCKD